MVQSNKSQGAACKNFERDLVLHYYGELSATERTTVEAHLKSCEPCSRYFKEMESMLPLTVKPDEPPQDFWDNYSREMRRKLAEVRERRAWWRSLASLYQPWAVPAMATTAIVVLALTFTFGRGLWQPKEEQPEDQSFMEVLPMAENLDFFSAMEVLDAMDLLEYLGASPNGAA